MEYSEKWEILYNYESERNDVKQTIKEGKHRKWMEFEEKVIKEKMTTKHCSLM